MRAAPPALLAGVLLALALAPAASAAGPVHADLEVRGPASFAGSSNGTADWAGSVHDARLAHAGPLQPLRAAGRASLETNRFVFARTNASSPPGYREWLVPSGNGTADLGEVGGEIRFLEGDAHASVRLLPRGATLPLGGAFALGSPFEVYDGLRQQGDARQGLPSADTYPGGGFRLDGGALPGPRAFTGRVVVTGFLLDVGGRAVDTRWTARSDEAPGLGGVESYETRLLRVEGTFVATAVDGDGWLTIVSGLAGTLDGRLSIRSSGGDLTIGSRPGPGDVPAFDADGVFTVAASYGKGSSRWAIDGTSSSVTANGVAYDQWLAGGVRAVAAATLLALLLAALAKWGNLLSLLPGVHRADPLGNGRRVRVLQLVAANPGINQLELARAADASRATVRHHLRVLLRADLLTERRLGAAATYTLNSGSFGFPAPGAGAVSAGAAMAWLRHPVRRRIVDALQDVAEADYEALCAVWRSRGQRPLGRWEVSHHGGLLEGQSIVRRRREGRRVLWSLAFRRDDALQRQRRAFLVSARLEATARALAAGPGDARAVRDRLQGAGVRSPVAEVRRQLLLLEATGYARQAAPGLFESVAEAEPRPRPGPRPSGELGRQGGGAAGALRRRPSDG
jgi:DNA-binding transcriptional ArsR family regulator